MKKTLLRYLLRTELKIPATQPIMIGNKGYMLVNEKWFISVMKDIAQTQKIKYKYDIVESDDKVYDCNSFSGLFNALADCLDQELCVGEHWGRANNEQDGQHAYNFFVTEERKIRFVEPQSLSVCDPNYFKWNQVFYTRV